jgi:DNA-binding transcriptional ArsR family regulator
MHARCRLYAQGRFPASVRPHYIKQPRISPTLSRLDWACRPCRQEAAPEYRIMATANAAVRSTAKPATAKVKAKKDDAQRLKQAQRAAILLKQASDPTRLQILMALAEGECHVGGLCEVLNQTQPAVSHHLALLRHGSLITPRRAGKNNFYALTDNGEALANIVKALV